MNILYLHGLLSKLNPKKRTVLEKYGEVFAPDIDYSRDQTPYIEILEPFESTEFNVVIGSSMGGLNAYIISNLIGRPALLFNPPLSKHPWSTMSPEPKFTHGLASKRIVLGAKDEVVNPQETLNCIAKRFCNDEIVIKIEPQLAHRIPLDVFETEVEDFFSKLCY